MVLIDFSAICVLENVKEKLVTLWWIKLYFVAKTMLQGIGFSFVLISFTIYKQL